MSPSKIILLLFLFLSFQGFAQEDTREELEKRRQALQEQISRIQGLRSSNLKQEKSILTQVEELNQQINAAETLLRVTNQQANLLTREITTNENRIKQLKEELEELKDDYIRMANYRKEQGEEIKRNTIESQELNESLAEQKKEKDILIAENRKTRAELEESKRAQQSLISVIRKKEGQFAAELRQKQREIDEIDRAIEKMIAEAIAASNKQSGSADREVFALTPAAKALAADFEKNKGKLPWPVKAGIVSMRFGTQPHPIVKTATMNSNGVRIDTDKGGKARSVFSGVVSEILVVPGSNKMVMVRHGDYITIYNNLEELQVRKGDQVAIGQELGTIATSKTNGKTTLYFVMYKNTTKLNPEHWIYKM